MAQVKLSMLVAMLALAAAVHTPNDNHKANGVLTQEVSPALAVVCSDVAEVQANVVKTPQLVQHKASMARPLSHVLPYAAPSESRARTRRSMVAATASPPASDRMETYLMGVPKRLDDEPEPLHRNARAAQGARS